MLETQPKYNLKGSRYKNPVLQTHSPQPLYSPHGHRTTENNNTHTTRTHAIHKTEKHTNNFTPVISMPDTATQ
jgi:hypothetical protein